MSKNDWKLIIGGLEKGCPAWKEIEKLTVAEGTIIRDSRVYIFRIQLRVQMFKQGDSSNRQNNDGCFSQ